MLFNSLQYAVFLPIVFILYWCIPDKYRRILLLIASYYFYMSWNTKYVVLIVTTTLISYLCAILIERTERPSVRRLSVFAALTVSLGILYVFKYYNFTLDLISHFVPMNDFRLNLLLPVGISFYTFQTLSYVIDVYMGKVQAEKSIIDYATFVSFFPQLVAGPIERASKLLPQIKSTKRFDYEAAKYGMRLILWGLYKKMVIADNLAVFVDQVYGDVQIYSGCSLLIVAVFFAFQIYCDFSGYSDIARGSAKLLNIDLMENFKSPYFSASIKEFWSRWHISLSTWFRDYVYIPMGGNRVSKIHNIINHIITFLVSGLWHGANMTFVVWGGIHGAGQIYEKAFGIDSHKKRDIYWVIRVTYVFVFATLAWVLFRAENIRDAIYVFENMFDGITSVKSYLKNGIDSLNIGGSHLIRIIIVYFLPLIAYDYFSLQTDVCEWIGRQKIFCRYVYIALIITLILIYGYVGKSTFVYFQF